MKRALLILALALTATTRAHALFDWQEMQDARQVFFSWTGIATSSSAIMVDLSDTSGFPHKTTGQIDITNTRLDISKIAASSGTVRVGVVTRVNDTNGDVSWFYLFDFTNDAAGTHYSDTMYYAGTALRCKVRSDGTTPFMASKQTTANSTVFQTDVNLPTTIGNTPPGVGDIVVQYTASGSGAINIALQLSYISEKP